MPRELEDKREEVIRLKEILKKITIQKNETLADYEKMTLEYDKEKEDLLKKIEILRTNIKETEALRSQNFLLEDKIISKENHIEFLQGENRDLNDRLQSIYSDGTEIEERIKDIKEKPYKNIELELQLNITDEIKYLNSIQENMKKYGVDYPKDFYMHSTRH